MITEQDEQSILAQNNTTLCRWWCLLNSFEWPTELPNPEPSEYISGGRRGQIMGFIACIVGQFAISQEWNCAYLTEPHRMTDREHHDFWFATYEDDPGAKVRYQEYSLRRIPCS